MVIAARPDTGDNKEMIISFNLYPKIIEFDMQIDAETDGLRFDSRIQSLPDNIRHIVQKGAAIDRINFVRLMGRTPVEIENTEFLINVSIGLYPTGETIGWDCKESLSEIVLFYLQIRLQALRPV